MTALVLLPGMDGSGHFFRDFCHHLGPEITPLVIAYPPDQALDYQGLTDFVRVRLPTDQPYFLLGESFSGPVAIALAAERPPLLAGLILSCTFARNPVPPLQVLRPLVRFAPLSSRWSALAAPFLLGWNAPLGLRQTLRSVLATTPASVLRLRLREVLAVDYSQRAAAIAVPVLYLQATRDRVVFAASGRHLAALLPSLLLARVSGPHLLLQVAPARAAEHVRAFMAAGRTAE
ncbi:alpha/beta fold hydrolase [Massilia sp. CF038]|uniref:alpha/beta fold hydrolase n=1 Tax=Massilia sp. CF038 TaxID=1881045 RepID=UPI00091053CD|nr:alpha/beta hydrolase [Massilia sp. CF038]SHH46201.1 Serine aminopeptidase, S33 [Massilia sp. CF038]